MVVRVSCRDCVLEGYKREVTVRLNHGGIRYALAERNRIERQLEEQHERGEHERKEYETQARYE